MLGYGTFYRVLTNDRIKTAKTDVSFSMMFTWRKSGFQFPSSRNSENLKWKCLTLKDLLYPHFEQPSSCIYVHNDVGSHGVEKTLRQWRLKKVDKKKKNVLCWLMCIPQSAGRMSLFDEISRGHNEINGVSVWKSKLKMHTQIKQSKYFYH